MIEGGLEKTLTQQSYNNQVQNNIYVHAHLVHRSLYITMYVQNTIFYDVWGLRHSVALHQKM